MKIRSASFQISAPSLEACPESALAEFAFIGRSNVGKSSLLNMLTGNDTLAKVSATPGHTRLINFFTINNQWSLVDLPGYGFAAASKGEQARFEDMISGYLSRRTNLEAVFVLIDSRHGPQPIDLEFVQWLQSSGVSMALVFTKVDKSKPRQVDQNIETFRASLGEGATLVSAVFKTSVETGGGRREILEFIEKRLTLD